VNFWPLAFGSSAGLALFMVALSALIRLCSGVGGLMISVIRIKYLACYDINPKQQRGMAE